MVHAGVDAVEQARTFSNSDPGASPPIIESAVLNTGVCCNMHNPHSNIMDIRNLSPVGYCLFVKLMTINVSRNVSYRLFSSSKRKISIVDMPVLIPNLVPGLQLSKLPCAH